MTPCLIRFRLLPPHPRSYRKLISLKKRSPAAPSNGQLSENWAEQSSWHDNFNVMKLIKNRKILPRYCRAKCAPNLVDVTESVKSDQVRVKSGSVLQR